MNVSKIKTLIPAPESAFHIELSNDNSVVNCDYSGNPIEGAVYESSAISLWYGGADAWSQFNVTVAANGITHGYNASTRTLNPSAIKTDTATIAVTARHKTRADVVLQATYTVAKNKAGSPGATPVSRSLVPSLHVIRKANDGTLLDTEISFEVHIRVGTVLTVVSTFGELYKNALDIKIGDAYIGDSSKGSQAITVQTATFWDDHDTQEVRLEHEVDTSICYDNEQIGVVRNGDDALPVATGLFVPAIVWVDADESGKASSTQNFEITPSVIVEGKTYSVKSVSAESIQSFPSGVQITLNSRKKTFSVSVSANTEASAYQGEVRMKLEATVDGETYTTIKDLPVVPNIKGEKGNGIVSITKTYAISKVGSVGIDTIEPDHYGSWSAGSPAVTSTYPYLWVKEVTVYTDTTKNTTKYYCVGKKGDRGIDGAGSEWVFIRTKAEVAPVIYDEEDPDGVDSNGHTYEDDDYLPLVHVSSGKVEGNNIANRGTAVWGDGAGEYGECTDDQKGVTETWPFEWVAKRTNILNGKSRKWQSYDDATAPNGKKMSLHAKYSTDGEDGVSYEIIPSVASIRADENGNILTGVITVSAYKTKGETRTSCGVGLAVAVGLNGETPSYYWVQYRVDSGSWTDCGNVGVGGGIFMQLGYGVPGSAVSTVKSGLAFRLCYGKSSSSYSVVHETAPMQVVKNGQTGQRGKTGRFYYYDGYFDSTKEYTATDNQAPYIAFDWLDTVTVNNVETQVTKTSYYMLVAETNKSGSTYIAPRTTAASGVWELMETSFKFIITQAFFSEFGKLGSAVFSGDWMISQHGTIDGMASTEYQKFDASDPTGKQAGHFVPNFAVDFLAGVAYMEDASVRGVIKVRAIYTVEGSLKTTNGKLLVDLEDQPGNSYVLPGNSTVYLPDPKEYAGLSLTLLFSANAVLAYEDGMYMAYYTGTTSVIQNGMSFKAVHSAEGLSVLTLQAIKAYGANSGVKWVVVGQRGILGVRNTISGADAFTVLPDGRLLTTSS